jgi:rubrerythrin
MSGGINAWNGNKAAGPKELNLDLISGEETPTEIIAIAYHMEESLGQFYRTAANQTTDPDLVDLLKKLANIEQEHKTALVSLNSSINPGKTSPDDFQSEIPLNIIEGGFNSQTLLEENKAFLQSTYSVLDLAMMLETQSLDLYLRFAEKSIHKESKAVLFKIASEEKGHLKALGELYDQKI